MFLMQSPLFIFFFCFLIAVLSLNVGSLHAQVTCAAGRYMKITGLTKDCRDCIPGTKCSNGLTQDSCGAGTTSKAKQSSCETCPVGHYCPARTGYPGVPCPAGRVRASTGGKDLSDCTWCDAAKGEYSDEPGGSTCKIARRGYFVADVATASQPCQPGNGSATPPSDTCVPCKAGTSSLKPGWPCEQCRRGWYCEGIGRAAQSCPVPGIGSDVKATTAEDCNIPCPKGIVCPGNGNDTISCPLGTHQPLEGQVDPAACKKCRPGTYSGSAPNEGECTVCLPGTFCPDEGLSFSYGCPAGTVSLAGAYSRDNCTDCPAGTVGFKRTQATCLECPAGGFCEGRDHFENCSAGTFNANEGAKSAADCIDAPEGSFTAASGMTSVDTCDAGQMSWPATRGTSCVDCAANHKSTTPVSNRCEPCPAGTEAKEPGSASCTPCGAGEWNTAKGEPCLASAVPAGTYRRATDTDGPVNCSTGTANSQTGRKTPCAPCEAGTWAPEHGAAKCEEVKQNFYREAWHTSGPLPCPAGTRTDGTGAKSINECLPCGDGEWSEVAGEPCRPCASGWHRPAGSLEGCRPCPISMTTEGRTGEAQCYRCEPWRLMTTAFAGSPDCVERRPLGYKNRTLSLSRAATASSALSQSPNISASETLNETESHHAVSPTQHATQSSSRSDKHRHTESRTGTLPSPSQDSRTVPSQSSSRTVPAPEPFFVAKMLPSSAKVATTVLNMLSGASSMGLLNKRSMSIQNLADCGKAPPHFWAGAPELGPDSNPFGFDFPIGGGRSGGDYYGAYRGALVSCVVVLAVWAAAIFLIALVRALVRRSVSKSERNRGTTFWRELRKCRWPSTLIVPASIMLPAAVSATGSLAKIYDPERKADVAVIGIGFVLLFLFPVLLLLYVSFQVKSHETLSTAVKPWDTNKLSVRYVLDYLFQPKRDYRTTRFLEKYGAVFDNISQPFYVVFVFIIVLSLAVSEGVSQMCTTESPDSCCSGPITTMIVLSSLDMLGVILLKNPFLVRFESLIVPLAITLDFVATVLVGYAYFSFKHDNAGLSLDEQRTILHMEKALGVISSIGFFMSMIASAFAILVELVPVLDAALSQITASTASTTHGATAAEEVSSDDSDVDASAAEKNKTSSSSRRNNTRHQPNLAAVVREDEKREQVKDRKLSSSHHRNRNPGSGRTAININNPENDDDDDDAVELLARPILSPRKSAADEQKKGNNRSSNTKRSSRITPPTDTTAPKKQQQQQQRQRNLTIAEQEAIQGEREAKARAASKKQLELFVAAERVAIANAKAKEKSRLDAGVLKE